MNHKMKSMRLDFKPSITLKLIISVIACGALIILILSALLWQIKWLLGIVILFSSLYVICLHGMLALPWSCVGLNVNGNSQMTLVLANGPGEI